MLIAIDESGEEKLTKYNVIGSVWIKKEHVCNIEKEITNIRIKHKCWGEAKWTKIKPNQKEFYKDIIKLIFNKNRKVFFRFIVLNKKNLYEKYGKNFDKKELWKLDAIYLLISRHSNKFLTNKEKQEIHILYDNFEESKESKDQQWRIKTKEKIQTYIESPIEHFQPCDSKINSAIQICDILTGTISSQWNKKEINETKQEIVNLIAELSNKNLSKSTFPSEKNFNIWNWQYINRYI